MTVVAEADAKSDVESSVRSSNGRSLRMVDVGSKPVTSREAAASGRIPVERVTMG